MLSNFADELRSARLKKNISLEQMAAKTRIDLKFLEAIDSGNFGFLPELYVKAFLKQYAKVVGLDEQETIERFEDARTGRLAVKDDSKSLLEKKIEIEKPALKTEKKTETVPPVQEKEIKKADNKTTDKKKILRLTLYTLGILLFALIIYFSFVKRSTTILVEETPYEKVLEETKSRYIVEDERKESFTNKSDYDSLVLNIANIDSLDSAWVMVIYDDKRKEDFLLYPKRAKIISARANFKLTLGNSGVIALTLNNQPISFDGLKRSVRHYKLSKDGMERLYSPPILNPE